MKTIWIIICGAVYDYNSSPIAACHSKKRAENWLRQNGYKQEKQGYGNPLFIDEGENTWCDIVKVDMIL